MPLSAMELLSRRVNIVSWSHVSRAEGALLEGPVTPVCGSV